jgi:hypothetical protein
MTKQTHTALRLIAFPKHGILPGRWWHAHVLHRAVDHDPNARAGEYLPHQPGPGLYGVLVSNRV